MRRSILAAVAALAVIVGMTGAFAGAQDGQGQEQGQGRRGGGQGQMDPAEMRARMLDNLKQRLGATDEEWQALQPKVERVIQAQTSARAGGMMGMAMGGRGGAGPGPGGGRAMGGPEGEPTALMTAGRELREVLQDEQAAADQIKAKLEAFRAARKEAQAELEAARGELQGLLTLRQEATLVAMGLLE